MNYKKKAYQIKRYFEEARTIDPVRTPLLYELVKRKEKARDQYFARINYNLATTGRSELKFDDIEYP